MAREAKRWRRSRVYLLIDLTEEARTIVSDGRLIGVRAGGEAGSASASADLERIVVLREGAGAGVSAVGDAIDVVYLVGAVDAAGNVSPDAEASDGSVAPPAPATRECPNEGAGATVSTSAQTNLPGALQM